MKFEYTYRNTCSDIWQLSMYYVYGSLAGLCNVIFTVAALCLTIVRWESFGIFLRISAILACCLFPVIQPLAIYAKAKKRTAKANVSDTFLRFDERGIYVRQAEESQEIKWNKIKRIAKKPTLILIFSDSTHGFVLPNRTLKGEREEFYTFLTSKVDKSVKKK